MKAKVDDWIIIVAFLTALGLAYGLGLFIASLV